MVVEPTDAMRGEHEERAHRAEVRGVARGGGLNLVGAGFKQALSFAITYLLARFLGQVDSGLYFQAFAIFALAGVLASGGFTQSLTRFVAVHRADGDQAALRGTLRLGLVVAVGAASFLGAALFAFSPWLADAAFHDPRLEVPLRLVALALPASVFTDCALAATQGFKTMAAYARVNFFFEPTMRLLLTIGALGLGFGLIGAMVALLATHVMASLLATWELRRRTGRSAGRASYNAREFLTFSFASWTSQLAASGLLWADTIILGLIRGPSDVALYHVATRLAVFVTIFIAPIGAAFAPRIADLYRRGKHDTLQRTYALVTSWIFRLALPAVILLVVFPRELLALFGPSFENGASVTALLALGQFVNALTGPCGLMLVMSGRPAIQTASNLSTLALNVAFNLYLIPRYGVIGAGVAWSASIALLNVERVLAVWATMHMLPLDWGLAKGAAAGLCAGTAGLLVRHLLDGPAALLVGTVAIAGVYCLALSALGIGPDDRLILAGVRRKLRPRRAGPEIIS